MSASTAPTPQESENIADSKPFKDSDAALRDALKKLDQEDWLVQECLPMFYFY